MKISFIGIGAQKSGSSWLYARLNELPDFSLTPAKELHYFDRGSQYTFFNELKESRLKDRLKINGWLNRAMGLPLRELLRGNIKNFVWYIKYYFSNYTDAWYLSLFESLDGIKGEITPNYSLLDEIDISRMKMLAPDAKIILLIRDPIERSWSHYRFMQKWNKDFNANSLSFTEIKKFIDSPAHESRSDYLTTLEKYSKYFSNNKIMIGFYDAIIQDPHRLLEDIVEFIGGDSSNVFKFCNIKKANNVSMKVKMPKEIEDYLKQKHHSLMKQLAITYGGYCEKWYIDYFGEAASPNSNPSQTKASTMICAEYEKSEV